MEYERKLEVIEAINEFCLSAYVSFTDFVITSKAHDSRLATHGEELLYLMSTGKITSTHSFYLKMFHMLLVAGDLDIKEVDILLLDEAGDLNEVTLKIFLELPAKKRVMVGDPNQNIYSFNKTINGFRVLSHMGTQLGLTNSFRVSKEIAMLVEGFARDTFDKNMEFKGIHYDNKTVTTTAFISRTNGQLISKMVSLNRSATPYNLVRPVKSIFALPLVLLALKRGGFVSSPQYKFLQDDTDDFYKSVALQKVYRTQLAYIAAIHSGNPGVKSAINMIHTHGPSGLIEAKTIAEKYEKSKKKYPLTLCTSHSSKG